jgi:hypothetical protein
MDQPDSTTRHSAKQGPSQAGAQEPQPASPGAPETTPNLFGEPIPVAAALGAPLAGPPAAPKNQPRSAIPPLEQLAHLSPAERLAAAKAAKAGLTRRPGRPKSAPPPPPAPPTPEVAAATQAARKQARKVAHRSATQGLAQEALINAGLLPQPRTTVRFEPTPEDRARVQTMAGLGFPRDQICLLVINPRTNLPIDVETLLRCFAREVEQGPVIANSAVAQALFKRATGTQANGKVDPQKASDSAAQFWLKTRAGWKEKSVVEVEIRSGVLVPPPTLSPEQWIESQARRNAERAEPTEAEQLR